MNEKKQVSQFRKKYHLKIINSAELQNALATQGYTVIEFNGINDSQDVSDLIDALKLEKEIRQHKCFTYQDDKYRLVFIHEDLNEEERKIVLAHEEGHIWNKHMVQNSIFGEDITEEYQANQFAHYLLDKEEQKKRKIVAIVISCALVIGIGSIVGFNLKKQNDENIYTENYYRTETGTKYHLKDCMYIKDKTDVYRLTKEEFYSGEYEPCEACMPDER